MDKKPYYYVIIAGTRTFYGYDLLKENVDIALKRKMQTHRVVIISGCANGADQLGIKYALERHLQFLKYPVTPSDWATYGNVAGNLRNLKMLDKADAVIAFWNGESHGTEHCVKNAMLRRIPTIIIRYKQDGGIYLVDKISRFRPNAVE